MAITADQVIARAVGRSGREVPSYYSSPLRFAEEALGWLFTTHKWKFLERPPADLDLVASVEYVILPDDFGTLHGLGVVATNGFTGSFTMTDPSSLLQARQAGVSPPDSIYVGALMTPASSLQGPPPRARLEIYPPPGTNQTAGLKLHYRAGNPSLSDGNSHVNVPWYCELLMHEVALALLLGVTEHDEAALESRMAALYSGAIFDAAKQYDGSTQPIYGRMKGGAVQLLRANRVDTTVLNSPVAGPS